MSVAGWEHIDADFLWKFLMVVTAFAILAKTVAWFFKKDPPDTEKYRHTDECRRLCDINIGEHKEIEGKLDKAVNEVQHAIEKFESRIDRFDHELQAKFDDLNERSEARAKAYHDRINPLESTVSRVDATSEIHSQQIYAIENRLNSHIEKAQK